MAYNVEALAMLGNSKLFSPEQKIVNEQKINIMHRRFAANEPLEQKFGKEQKADNISVSPSIANAPVGRSFRPEIVCYCGSLRVALEAFKKAEYESVLKGEIALLPCCMFVDIEREYGAESDYKVKADDLHKRKIDIADKVFVLNVGGYIGQSTRSEINYALAIGKTVEYLETV